MVWNMIKTKKYEFVRRGIYYILFLSDKSIEFRCRNRSKIKVNIPPE